jgi:hypothetical protein
MKTDVNGQKRKKNGLNGKKTCKQVRKGMKR